MELYAERGYEQTTVAEIAERAGLTARTFFRYFADKREVLFAGSDELQEQLVDGRSTRAPEAATPMAAVARGARTRPPRCSASAATSPASGRRSSPPTPSCGSAS